MQQIANHNLNFKIWLEASIRKYSCVLGNIPEAHLFTGWVSKHVKDEYIKKHENEPHVTVLYGLHTENPDEVKETLANEKPFKIKLGLVSKFSAPEFDVLKIDVESTELFDLNKKLRTLEYTTEHKYKPHVTLSYVEKDSCDNLIGSEAFDGKTFKISKLLFSTPNKNKTIINLA